MWLPNEYHEEAEKTSHKDAPKTPRERAHTPQHIQAGRRGTTHTYPQGRRDTAQGKSVTIST